MVIRTGLIFSGIGGNNLVIKPHVSDSHTVLGQSSGLIGANGGGGSQSFDGFQVLDQAVLLCHTFGGKGKTYLL